MADSFDPNDGVPPASNRAATELFVGKHMPWMLSLARRYTKDWQLAEDVVQNSFTKIFSHSDQFEGSSSIQAWMRRIVINEALMLLRKRKPTKGELDIDDLMPIFDQNDVLIADLWASAPATADQNIMSREKQEIVHAAVDKLPETYRLALLVRDIDERSTKEAASLLEISETNLKVRLHRARAALKALLEPAMREGLLP